jgi:1,2-diacylglycerol 3-alpha-glucosyltransferase
MACSLPIVCRRDPCLKGVLENGVNGYSFETGDEFCQSITQLLENEDIRLKYGENARKMSSRFSDRYFVDSLLEIYGKIITKPEGVFVQ